MSERPALRDALRNHKMTAERDRVYVEPCRDPDTIQGGCVRERECRTFCVNGVAAGIPSSSEPPTPRSEQ